MPPPHSSRAGSGCRRTARTRSGRAVAFTAICGPEPLRRNPILHAPPRARGRGEGCSHLPSTLARTKSCSSSGQKNTIAHSSEALARSDGRSPTRGFCCPLGRGDQPPPALGQAPAPRRASRVSKPAGAGLGEPGLQKAAF